MNIDWEMDVCVYQDSRCPLSIEEKDPCSSSGISEQREFYMYLHGSGSFIKWRICNIK